MADPQLLKIPEHFQTVDDVLGCAAKLNLRNILVLSEMENGNLVILDDGLTMAQANWLVDRFKTLMLSGATSG